MFHFDIFFMGVNLTNIYLALCGTLDAVNTILYNPIKDSLELYF